MKWWLLTLLGTGMAFAQEPVSVEMSQQDGENVTYAYADVLRANPTYEIIEVVDSVAECGADLAQDDDDAAGDDAHVLTLGLATQPKRRECGNDTVLHEERRISGYDVEYRYRGQVYMSHMEYDPGNKLRIRISVAPVD